MCVAKKQLIENRLVLSVEPCHYVLLPAGITFGSCGYALDMQLICIRALTGVAQTYKSRLWN